MTTFKKKDFGRGLNSFMERKRLKMEVFEKFAEENGYKRGQDVNDFFARNWQKFANFVESGLKRGEIKGKRVKTSNGSSEYAAEKSKWFRNYVPEDIKSIWTYLKNGVGKAKNIPRLGERLNNFFVRKGISRDKTDTAFVDNPYNFVIMNYQNELRQLSDLDLLDEFITYLKEL
jgi:hypothetical protein